MQKIKSPALFLHRNEAIPSFLVFANMKILSQQAQRGKYAVGHFNVNNMELVQGVVAAAVQLRAPVILATSEGALKYGGAYLISLAKVAAQQSSVPVALHLDHGKDMKIIELAIKMGYSSVMIDASHEPFEKNIRLTRKVVQLAHRHKVMVEAELGTIGGAEDSVASRRIIYTDPVKAAEFAARTGCDTLAVAIGTSHGAYKFSGKAKLRLDILKEIRKRVKIPLVLHGASSVSQNLVKEAEKYGAVLPKAEGVPDSQIRAAITLGICKVNTDTDLRLAFEIGMRKALQRHPEDIDPRHALAPAREMVQKVVEQRIRLLGSGGKA